MRKRIEGIKAFEQKLFRWVAKQPVCMCLDGQGFNTLGGAFPRWVATGARRVLTTDQDGFGLLKKMWTEKPTYLFGYFTYDLKNEILQTNKIIPDKLEFPKLFFFEPLHLIKIEDDFVEILSEDANQVIREIEQEPEYPIEEKKIATKIHCEVSKREYLNKVRQIQEHIREGDVYELNYCLNFFADNVMIPPHAFPFMRKYTPAPFSFFLNTTEHSIYSFSPERFLKKSGDRLISQPMKGTIKRGATETEDRKQIEILRSSEKERAENMMIVDLVRNDLARSCQAGTVKVDELFGIYPFPKVHQMISTVSGILRPELEPIEAIKNAFPMGSMTGAPKIRAMELIEFFEAPPRGVFSGTAGYFTPEGNFDFNVIIRSLLYNKKQCHASLSAGSAITYDSDPEMEYEECLLKAGSLVDFFFIDSL